MAGACPSGRVLWVPTPASLSKLGTQGELSAGAGWGPPVPGGAGGSSLIPAKVTRRTKGRGRGRPRRLRWNPCCLAPFRAAQRRKGRSPMESNPRPGTLLSSLRGDGGERPGPHGNWGTYLGGNKEVSQREMRMVRPCERDGGQHEGDRRRRSRWRGPEAGTGTRRRPLCALPRLPCAPAHRLQGHGALPSGWVGASEPPLVAGELLGGQSPASSSRGHRPCHVALSTQPPGSPG